MEEAVLPGLEGRRVTGWANERRERSRGKRRKGRCTHGEPGSGVQEDERRAVMLRGLGESSIVPVSYSVSRHQPWRWMSGLLYGKPRLIGGFRC